MTDPGPTASRGARVVARLAIGVLAIVVPWLAITARLEPLALRVAVAAAAILAAFHGLGTAVAVLTHDRVRAPWLRIAWGAAGYVLIAGPLLACGALDAAAQRAIVIAGLALHSIAVGVAAGAAPAAPWRLRPGPWLVPAGLACAIAAVHLFGAAGRLSSSFFDDDGHFLGQLARLAQTGGLDDAVGYAREAQLGGQLALAALAGLTDDLRTARMVDGGVALIITFGLSWSYVRPRTAHAIVWITLLVLMVSGLRLVSPEPAPFWTAVALVVAAYVTTCRPRDSRPWIEARRALPVALLGGALATLRFELVPVGVAIAVAAGVAAVPRGQRLRPVAWQLVAVLAVIAPYALARALARRDVPDLVAAALARGSATELAPALLAAALVALAVSLPLLVAGIRDQRAGRPFLGLSIAVAVGVAGLVSGAVAGGAYRWRFVVPVLLAWGLVVLVELARARPPTTIGDDADDPAAPVRIHSVGYAVALAAVCVAIVVARAGKAPRTWWDRYARMFDDAEHLLHVRAGPPASDDSAVLATLPRGERVAVWVDHPERLDYRAHAILDLRTPRLGRLARHHTWDVAAPSELGRLLDTLAVRYVLIGADNARNRRAEKVELLRLLCRPGDPEIERARLYRCADDLERLALDHLAIARAPGLVLVDRGR